MNLTKIESEFMASNRKCFHYEEDDGALSDSDISQVAENAMTALRRAEKLLRETALKTAGKGIFETRELDLVKATADLCAVSRSALLGAKVELDSRADW